MALTQSVMSIGNLQNMETKRKNRWQLSFVNIPNESFTGSDAQVNMDLSLLSASRPSWNFEEVEIHRLNEKFYVPGKVTYEPITIVYQDLIDAKTSEVIFDWSKTVYNPFTGAMGYKNAIGVDAYLAMLDPLGVPVEIWNLFGAWPQSANFQDLDMSSSEQANIEIVLRYDRCIVNFINDNPNVGKTTSSAFNPLAVMPPIGDPKFGIAPNNRSIVTGLPASNIDGLEFDFSTAGEEG